MSIALRLSATLIAVTIAVLSEVAAPRSVSHTFAGAVEFGAAALREALRSHGLSTDRLTVERRQGAAKSWSIASDRITGADERGLMYGLLEAAHQIETSGRLTAASGQPATPIRGIRTFIHNQDLEARWYFSSETLGRVFLIAREGSVQPVQPRVRPSDELHGAAVPVLGLAAGVSTGSRAGTV